jgi:MFS family permease
MTAAFFACGFQLMFITAHLPAYLASCGIPASVGGTAMGIIGLCNTVGTYAVGVLGGRYSQKRLLASLYLFRTLSIIVFLAVPISRASTLVFAAAMGLLWLGVAPLVSGLVGRVFGLTHFGTLYGFVFLSHSLGSMAGALLGGVVFDLTQSYGFAWAALIVIGLLAFALQWAMDDRPVASAAAAVPDSDDRRPTDLASLGDGISARWHNQTIGAFNGNHLRFRVMEDAAADWHAHEDSDELFVVLSGRVAIDTEGGSHELGADELLVVPARLRHRARVEGRATLLVADGFREKPRP